MKKIALALALLLAVVPNVLFAGDGKVGEPKLNSATVTGGNDGTNTVQQRFRTDGAAATSDESYLVNNTIILCSNKTINSGAADSTLLPVAALQIPKKWSILKFRTALEGAGLLVSYRVAFTAGADTSVWYPWKYGATNWLGHTFKNSVNVTAGWHNSFFTPLRDSTASGFETGEWLKAPFIVVRWENVSGVAITFDHSIWGTP